MSFPITLSPSTPTGLDSPRLGDDEFRNLKQALADLFTLPVSPSTISAAIGSVSTAGKFTLTNALWNGDVVGVAYGGTALSTIAAAATTATTITIPADAILKAVEMRVTVAPPGTATMVVTATTSGTILQQGASMSTAINTTDVGTRAWGTNYVGVAAQTITITPNATPSDATGRVRFDIYYEQPTAPTS